METETEFKGELSKGKSHKASSEAELMETLGQFLMTPPSGNRVTKLLRKLN